MTRASSPESLVAACDDGVVRKLGWGSGFTVVACVSWSIRESRPLSASIAPVRVDGLDASSIIAALVEEVGAAGAPVLLDSVTIAGFNVVSPASIIRLAGSPVIYVYKYMPSLANLRRGLESSRLPLSGLRLKIIEAVISRINVVETRRGKLYMSVWGLPGGVEAAIRLVEACQVHARTPEPLRVAHFTASGVSRAFFDDTDSNAV